MPGAGLFPKVKWLLPVTAFLFLISWRGAFFTETLCVNVNLLRLRTGGEAQCVWTPDEFEADVRPEKTRLIWLQGYSLWVAGDFNQAMAVWPDVPQYAADMLTTWVQNDKLTEANVREAALTQALLLDPNTLEVSEIASFHLFEERQWDVAYAAFTAVTKAAPENAVAKAALALAGRHLERPEDEVVGLYDMAVAEAPENVYVLRYGLRLMQLMPAFGEQRTARLAVRAAEQLPRDFEFTFGVANAFRNVGNLETAMHYNLMALSINPVHPWTNLQQVELLQLQGEHESLDPWLEIAINGRVSGRPDYYQRLLAVLLDVGKVEKAQEVLCDGLSQGMLSDALVKLLDNKQKKSFYEKPCEE